MKQRRWSALLLGMVLLLTLSACGGGGWKEHRSNEGGFAVSTPGEMTRRTDVLTTPVGPLPSVGYIYSSSDRRTSYGVDYADYPANVARGIDPERLLDAVADELVRKVQGRQLQRGGLAIERNPGREMTVAAPGGFVRARIFLVGQRQYQVVAVTPDERTGAKDAEKFLNSFKLVR